MPRGKITVSIDVTDALPADVTEGATIQITAWIFPPAPEHVLPTPTTIVLMNGGSYDKRYHHFEVPGESGYSAAEALAERGHLVILPDHLGIADSSRLPTQKKGTRRIAALANHAAVTEIYRRLEAGTLDPSLAPMPKFRKLGGGHSMGASQSLAQQADHKTYDALLVIGYTAVGVHLMRDGKQVPRDTPYDDARGDYVLTPHSLMRDHFHWDDVSEAALAVDIEIEAAVPQMISNASVGLGIATEDASRIDVPVFFCVGERDVSPNPYQESGYFTSCRDFLLYILPRSSHCQTFASTRQMMFDRIDGWARGLPE